LSSSKIQVQGSSKKFDFSISGIYNWVGEINEPIKVLKGGEGEMRRKVYVILSLLLAAMFIAAVAGCGADIKAENEKLKVENGNLKSDNDKLKIEVQKLKEEIQKGAEKESTITSLTAENEALKKQVEDLKSQLTKKKK
jgi:cell division protein FtsB